MGVPNAQYDEIFRPPHIPSQFQESMTTNQWRRFLGNWQQHGSSSMIRCIWTERRMSAHLEKKLQVYDFCLYPFLQSLDYQNRRIFLAYVQEQNVY